VMNGQVEMLRAQALGNFRDLLVNIARDPAMMYWLDNRLNTRVRPQENFARELMELFTTGVGHFTEPDVYAAARVFTGWSVAPAQTTGTDRYEFVYNSLGHDAGEKTFSFPIYRGGGRTIPARAPLDGMQDGLDLIDALAAHPATIRRLAAKLYHFFVSDAGDVPAAFVNRLTTTYQRTRYDMRAVIHDVLSSPEFWDQRSYFSRHSWPVEFVVRSIKEVGWSGYSLINTLAPLSNMGQNLYDPPDVNGWEQGAAWFSTGSMLARMNFASDLARIQRINLAKAAQAHARTPQALLSHVTDSLRTAPLSTAVVGELSAYLVSSGPWTGSAEQVAVKVPGVVHLLASTPEYQFV
jgi:uncharacterized protein (DUF1800 family)